MHPGVRDRWGGFRNHDFTILFDLPSKPEGTFYLTVAFTKVHFLIPPKYIVNLNGQTGTWVLKATDPYTIQAEITASALKKGPNKLVLTTREGSCVYYDALSLSNDPTQTLTQPAVKTVGLAPTVRFVRRDGKLKQIADLTAEIDPRHPACTATIKVGNKAHTIDLKSDLRGNVKHEIEFDELSKPTRVEAAIGDRTASCEARPEKHWKLYLEPSSHVDVGYSASHERVIEVHNDNLTKAVELCNKYPHFKWNTEAAWVEDNYLSMMPEDRKSAFIKLAQQQRIGCNAICANILTGLCSHEALIRDMYFSHSVAREYGVPFDMAVSSDVPTQVWTLPMILADSGIKYFVSGGNQVRSLTISRFFDKSLFYWQGADGSKVLTVFTGHYATASMLLGLSSTIDEARPMVDKYLTGYDRESYPYDAVLAYGAYGDNCSLDDELASVTEEWNKRYAYPRIVFSRGVEFFQYVETAFNGKIPTIAGDTGTYWEDGASSSAYETSVTRRAEADLVSAEKLHSLAAALGGSSYPSDSFTKAWKNALMYDEHTWGAHCSISEPKADLTVELWNAKAAFSRDAGRLSSALLRHGMNELSKQIKTSEPAIVVFNPLSWPVSGLAQCDGVQFWAKDVPALGYRVFPAKQAAQAAQVSGESTPVVENQFYRLELDPVTGAVKSLYDKELGRELVDRNAEQGLNQFIYMAGYGDEAKGLTRDANTPAVTIAREISPSGTVIRVKGTAHTIRDFTTTIVLYDAVKRVDFLNVIDKVETTDKEAGYYAFPFLLDKPRFHISLPNGTVCPNTDMMDGACMQWYSAQDFVAATDDTCAVVWTAVDTPLVTLSDINRDRFWSPLPISNGHLYAYLFNNYWFGNYKASQGGELSFRFSLTSMRDYDPVAATRFGQSVRNPLVAKACEPQASGSAKQGELSNWISV